MHTRLKLLIGTLSAFISLSGYAQTPLPERVLTMLAAAGLTPAHMGVSVIRLRDGAEVMAHRADAPMQPASTIKVLTAIVGLDTLGPTYRGTTELRSSAALNGSRLGGDIVLRGLASPDFDVRALTRMLKKLRADGIQHIDGDLVLDRGFFNPPRHDIGVPPFDETPEFRYNVIPDPLLLNTNLLQFEITHGNDGLQIRTDPPLEGVWLGSRMRLIDRKCADWEQGWKLPTVEAEANGDIRITLDGEFPKNCRITTELNLIERSDFTRRMFATLWQQLGGSWRGQVREASLGDSGRVLASHESRTLAEFVRDVNKRSDNTITRLLLLTLGARAKTGTDTNAEGEAVVRAWLKANAIDDTGLILDNGSGLSRAARIAPATLARTLQAATKSPWAAELMASLPIAATDGGLRARLKDSPAARTARLKTGGLRNVASLAGYVTNSAGEQHALVVMLNNDEVKGSVMRPILDALVDAVARAGGT